MNTRGTPDRAWRATAFVCSAAAAGIHFGAVHDHRMEWMPAAMFMLAAGLAQLTWAIWISRSQARWLLTTGIAGNAGIVVLWIVSRTAGLGVGPMSWGRPEEIRAPDLLCTTLEVLLVVSAIALRSERIPSMNDFVARLAVLGAVASVFASGNDPGHERLGALAGLLLAIAIYAFLETRRSVSAVGRRRHVTFTLRDDARAGGRIGARAGLGESG